MVITHPYVDVEMLGPCRQTYNYTSRAWSRRVLVFICFWVSQKALEASTGRRLHPRGMIEVL